MRGPLIPAECNHSYTQVSDSTPWHLAHRERHLATERNIVAEKRGAFLWCVFLGFGFGQSESEKDRRYEDVRRMREQFRGQEASRLLFLIQDKILEAAEVICATCMTAGSDMLGKRNFTRVLLDEATQSTEIATLVRECVSE